MSIHRAIGIDLGTTNSVMAMMHRGEPKIVLNVLGNPLTPSVVSVDKRREHLVGKAAKSRAFDRNTIGSIKRFMGLPWDLVQDDRVRVSYEVSEGPGGEVRVHFNEHTYSPTEISAMILFRLRQDAQDRLGEPVGRAVITVPAYFNDAQVAATREAGRMAGFTVMRIIREPTAAALAFGLDRGGDGDDASVLVYDLGGGTFDISIMTMVEGIFDVRGIEGDKHLGGDDFDFEIMNYLYRGATGGQDLKTDPAARRLLKTRAEEAKTELSSVTCVEINIPSVAGVNIETELTRDEFNGLIKPWIERTVDLMHKAMRETNMSPALIRHILLVGGSTLIPYVQERLREEFGQEKIKKNVDPMHCVALGAAIQTSLLNQIECPNPECRDVTGRQTQNPIEAEKCSRCGTSLVGFEVMTCPNCFVPTDATQATCRKCRAVLRPGTGAAKSVQAPPPVTQLWKCQECGHPKNPMSAAVCEICGQPREAGGVKCNKCGQLNPPGTENCAHCGEPMSIVFEAIPENLGIELHDGRMAVLVRKNTGYPTSKPIARDFRVPEANQKQLEVIVRQGPSDQAGQNEYCGVVLLDLPPNVPKGAAVTVSFGLDSDGTIIATVQLRDYPDRRVTARIIRGGASKPEVRQRRDELVQKARKALDEGSSLPGAQAFAQQTDELERSAEAEDLEQFEKELAAFHAQAEQERELQFALGASEMILQIASEYLATDDEVELKRLSQNAQRALKAGKKEELHLAVQALMKFLDTHQIYLLLASLEMVRRGGKISQGLANRIGAGLTRLKSARSEADIAGSFKELMECWDEARRELEQLGEKVPGPVRPTD